MEVRVESAEGCSMPSGCFVGVRIGETLKQGRYEPQRCYHFPQVDRRRNAKIDVYQHVGSCTVAVEPDAKSNHDVAVTSTNPSWPGLRLNVSVQSKADADTEKKQREQRVKTLKNQANDYLARHNIEERLSEAVKSLLKEQPADPTEFLCRMLRSDSLAPEQLASPQQKSAQKPPPQPVQQVSAQPLQQSAPKTEQLDPLRQQACEALMKASEDGQLSQVLNDIKHELEPEPVDPAPAPVVAARPTRSSQTAAPVKLDMPPPAMMMSTMARCGPAFSSMGMRPAMFFI